MEAQQSTVLATGTQLGDYKITQTLAQPDGFGVTYLASDKTNKPVTIREYLPSEFASRAAGGALAVSPTDRELFAAGLKTFVQSAGLLAKIAHPTVVKVFGSFEANGTGYVVVEQLQGEPLSELLKRDNTLDEARLHSILLPLADGLELVHNAGLLHYDIKPESILIRPNGSPVLVGFSADRNALRGKGRAGQWTPTAGYSSLERYSPGGSQGPWTDVYALGAVAYRLISGRRPPNATDRSEADSLRSAGEIGAGSYHRTLLEAVDWALRVKAEDRPQSMLEWKDALLGLRELQGAGATQALSASLIRRISEMRQEKRAQSATQSVPAASSTTAAPAAVASPPPPVPPSVVTPTAAASTPRPAAPAPSTPAPNFSGRVEIVPGSKTAAKSVIAGRRPVEAKPMAADDASPTPAFLKSRPSPGNTAPTTTPPSPPAFVQVKKPPLVPVQKPVQRPVEKAAENAAARRLTSPQNGTGPVAPRPRIPVLSEPSPAKPSSRIALFAGFGAVIAVAVAGTYWVLKPSGSRPPASPPLTAPTTPPAPVQAAAPAPAPTSLEAGPTQGPLPEPVPEAKPEPEPARTVAPESQPPSEVAVTDAPKAKTETKPKTKKPPVEKPKTAPGKEDKRSKEPQFDPEAQKLATAALFAKLKGKWTGRSSYDPPMPEDSCGATVTRDWTISFDAVSADGLSTTGTFKTSFSASSSGGDCPNKLLHSNRVNGEFSTQTVSAGEFVFNAKVAKCSGDCDDTSGLFDYRALERDFKFTLAESGDALRFDEQNTPFGLKRSKGVSLPFF